MDINRNKVPVKSAILHTPARFRSNYSGSEQKLQPNIVTTINMAHIIVAKSWSYYTPFLLRSVPGGKANV